MAQELGLFEPRSRPAAVLAGRPPRLSIAVLGTSLSAFLVISFLLCVALGLAAPDLPMPWLQFLPGVTWLTWSSLLLGLAESVVYGWYAALVFVPLFNALDVRLNSQGGR